MTDDVRFLPSYVGSKRHWLPTLQTLKGRPFAELFAGSAILSANLASTALLVDLDPVVARILGRFDEQEVPETFTRDDYYRLRSDPQWWRYAYALQSLSYSGVFRYSKNGYNVPAKGGPDPVKNKVNEFHVRPAYLRALERWQELAPEVRCQSYLDITDRDIAALGEHVIVVLDPPYEGSQAAYNGNGFNYDAYWNRVHELVAKFDVLLFDRQANIEKHGYEVSATRKMRVNGARPGDSEALSVIPKGTSGR
ncbi:DNA adenine methylase [Curtobacterium sp. MCBD17_040]|uniref:DNA adenine methylase n=1 Tax=Curtobacterium sp. MCBD17_040 TaxID=2175674 RepID=UPI000DA7899A|nr:DNA adenine methylase [Curtobacterium sp. MCBD17_040]WIB65668.1 DNA adenine methylase [Curtobacterium sp. MCBD17_040]